MPESSATIANVVWSIAHTPRYSEPTCSICQYSQQSVQDRLYEQTRRSSRWQAPEKVPFRPGLVDDLQQETQKGLTDSQLEAELAYLVNARESGRKASRPLKTVQLFS